VFAGGVEAAGIKYVLVETELLKKGFQYANGGLFDEFEISATNCINGGLTHFVGDLVS
jgi:hypothetical protein